MAQKEFNPFLWIGFLFVFRELRGVDNKSGFRIISLLLLFNRIYYIREKERAIVFINTTLFYMIEK